MAQNGGIAIPPFSRFDVVSDHSDHYYSSSGKKDKYVPNVQKLIMKEWRILENLPDSIYVRVYDTRIDLLRAVIVGAAATPYHDALFFFDISFPTDYPSHPPRVHYRSFGLRVNPNLYASGYVCLSLLNTWAGKKREKWDPAQSTILQVLLSIQALVLNEKPYFNEPGTGSPGGSGSERRSRAYNEDVFVLTCKTTLFTLRNPPRNFEAFTAGHFRERGSRILRACGAYVNGRVAVGYYREGGAELEPCRASSSSKSKGVVVSKKFTASMQGLYPQLVQVFKNNGTLNLGEELEVETTKTTPVKAQVDKKADSVQKQKKIDSAKKLIGKLGEYFCLGSKKNQKMEKSDKKDVNAGVAVAGC